MITYQIYGIVKSKGKTIAVGNNGLFSTDDERIINKLDNLGFNRVETVEETPIEEKPKKVKKPKVKE